MNLKDGSRIWGKRLEYVKVMKINYVKSFIGREIGELYPKVLIMIVLGGYIMICIPSFYFFAIIQNIYPEQIIHFIIVLL